MSIPTDYFVRLIHAHDTSKWHSFFVDNAPFLLQRQLLLFLDALRPIFTESGTRWSHANRTKVQQTM